jgi:hypothetical protein
MNTQCPINATTVDTLGQYNQAAKHLIAAYRLGTARVMAGAGERYEQFLSGRSLLSDDLKQRLIGAEQKAGSVVVGAVARVADKADSWADSLAQRAVAGVELLDEKTAWSRDVAVLNALRRLNLPVAKASLKLAENVADVSRRVSARVAGQPDVVADTVKTVKAGVKKARAGAKRVQRAVRTRA